MTDRFIRQPEITERTGLSRTTIWRQERQGKFPKRRKISENAVGWLESEITGWFESKATNNPDEASV